MIRLVQLAIISVKAVSLSQSSTINELDRNKQVPPVLKSSTQSAFCWLNTLMLQLLRPFTVSQLLLSNTPPPKSLQNTASPTADSSFPFISSQNTILRPHFSIHKLSLHSRSRKIQLASNPLDGGLNIPISNSFNRFPILPSPLHSCCSLGYL